MGARFSCFNCLKGDNEDGPSKPKGADEPTPRAPAAKQASSGPVSRTTQPEGEHHDASQQPDTAPALTPPAGVLAPAAAPEVEQTGLSSDSARAPETDISQLQRVDTIEIIIDPDEVPSSRAPQTNPNNTGQPRPATQTPPPPPRPPRSR